MGNKPAFGHKKSKGDISRKHAPAKKTLVFTHTEAGLCIDKFLATIANHTFSCCGSIFACSFFAPYVRADLQSFPVEIPHEDGAVHELVGQCRGVLAVTPVVFDIETVGFVS